MIITIANPIGGTGKTMLTHSLATRFSQDGKSVLVVDMTPVNSSWFTYYSKKNPDWKPGYCGRFVNSDLIHDILQEVKSEFDIVIVDTVSSLSYPVEQAIFSANVCLLPVILNSPGSEEWNELMDLFLSTRCVCRAAVVNRFASDDELTFDARRLDFMGEHGLYTLRNPLVLEPTIISKPGPDIWAPGPSAPETSASRDFELVYEEVQQLMVASTMDEGHWEPHLYNWFQYFVPVESE